MEPILIGAAIGGGVSAATGGNPLLGAALGAAGGGLGAAAGGAGGAAAGGASGATGGATGGAVGGATGGTVGGATGATAAQAFPVAMQAPITATPLAAVGSSAPTMAQMAAMDAGLAATGQGFAQTAQSAMNPSLLGQMEAMDLALAVTGKGFAQTAGLGDGVSTFEKLGKLAPFAGQLMGGGQQQQPQMSAPAIRRGQAPQVVAPIDELMRMQMMAQRQRSPISLL